MGAVVPVLGGGRTGRSNSADTPPAMPLNRPLQGQDRASTITRNCAWWEHKPRRNPVLQACFPVSTPVTRIGSRSIRSLCRIACLPFRDPAKRSDRPAARTETAPN